MVFFSNTWFFWAGPVPITIDGDVRGGYDLSLTARASGNIYHYNATRKGSTSCGQGTTYLSNPETEVAASLCVRAQGDCTGTVGFPGVGVGLDHEIHIFSPLRSAPSSSRSTRR